MLVGKFTINMELEIVVPIPNATKEEMEAKVAKVAEKDINVLTASIREQWDKLAEDAGARVVSLTADVTFAEV